MDKPRVLVADREPDNADTLATLLSTNGLITRVAYDGQEAIDIARDWSPDGAMIDLSLRRASGYQVAQSLRESFGKGIRLVAFTAWTGAAIHRRAIDAGFDFVILKPSTPA